MDSGGGAWGDIPEWSRKEKGERSFDSERTIAASEQARSEHERLGARLGAARESGESVMRRVRLQSADDDS